MLTLLKEGDRMPLSMSAIGEKRKIIQIRGNHHTRKRVMNLGILEGDEIIIVSRLFNNIIVMVKETKIALSMEISTQIYVE